MKKLAQILGLSLGLSLVPTGCNQPKMNVEARLCNGHPTTVLSQDNKLKYMVRNTGVQEVQPNCISFENQTIFDGYVNPEDCQKAAKSFKLDWSDGGIDDDLEVTGDIKPEDVTLNQEGSNVSVTVNGYTAHCN